MIIYYVGHDAPFVNNYGVWKDEFDDLNLTHTLEHIWKNTECHFSVDKKVSKIISKLIGLYDT